MSLKKVIGLILFFNCYQFAHSQTVAGNANLRILVAGLNNKIEIAKEGISRKNLVVYCKDYKVVDSIGYFFIDIPEPSKRKYNNYTLIYIGDKSDSKNEWLDSLKFDIRRLPKIEPMLGILGSGAYPKAAILAWSNLINAYLPNVWINGIKATVTSYHFQIKDFNNLLFVSKKIEGNSAKNLKYYLNDLSSGAELKIDSIKAVMNGKIYYLEPLIFNIDQKEVPRDNTIVLLEQNNKWVTYDGQSVSFNPDEFSHKRLIKLQGKETINLIEQIGSLDSLLLFKKYYDSLPNVLKYESKRISDTSYFIRYFNAMGKCVAEGESITPLINDYKDNKTIIGNPNFLVRWMWWLENRQISPVGLWKFYYPNGKIMLKGHFKLETIVKIDNDPTIIIIVCGGSYPNFDAVGPWEFYDENGKLLKTEKF